MVGNPESPNGARAEKRGRRDEPGESHKLQVSDLPGQASSRIGEGCLHNESANPESGPVWAMDDGEKHSLPGGWGSLRLRRVPHHPRGGGQCP